MKQITEIRSQVWELIDGARRDGNPESLRNVRQLLVEAVHHVDQLNRQTFRRRDFVQFKTRAGETLIGVIDRINTKSVSLTVVSPPHQRGREWKVSPSLITPVQAPPDALKPVSDEEAIAAAMRVCGAPADGFDFTPNHIATRAGKHLVFVDTPKHGYFVAVSEHGQPQIVGEEDCGISTSWVTRFFSVDRYGQRR